MKGSYEGPSMYEPSKSKKYDMWCPLCCDGENKDLNFWKKQCLTKQAMKIDTCYPTCKAKDIIALREKYMKANRGNNGGCGRPKLPHDKKEHVIKLLKEDIHTFRGIAKLVGVSTGTVSIIKKQLTAYG